MSTAYMPKNPSVQSVCLQVQELSLQLTDTSVLSTSGTSATLNIGEPVSRIVSASKQTDASSTSAQINSANRSVSGSTITLTLPSAMATNDVITVRYVTYST